MTLVNARLFIPPHVDNEEKAMAEHQRIVAMTAKVH